MALPRATEIRASAAAAASRHASWLGITHNFPAQDLAVASPATVSRCGMVYVSEAALNWRQPVQTWLSSALPDVLPSAELRETVWQLCEGHIDAALAWIAASGAELIPVTDLSRVSTLTRILSALSAEHGSKLTVRALASWPVRRRRWT